MRIATPKRLGLLGLGVILAIGLPVAAQVTKKDAIGLFTAVAGRVLVVHIGEPAASPAKLREDVFFKDLLETQADSRTKALFQDDSILTVGENSRVEINEHVFDPANNQRSTVLRLVKGRLRALVGKFFAGSGSKFEVHTATAAVAARGTYFVVWIEEKPGTKVGEAGTVRPVLFPGIDVAQAQVPVVEGATGVANIGSSGDVAFTAAGKTVVVKPGMASVAAPGGPPIEPVPYTSTTAPAVIKDTELADQRLSGPGPVAAPPTFPGCTASPNLQPCVPPSVMSGSGLHSVIGSSVDVSGAPGDSIVPGAGSSSSSTFD